MTSEQPVTSAAGAPVPAPRAGGQRRAGYELLAELGQGALSTVHRVRAPAGAGRRPGPEPGAEYAMKLLAASPADREAALRAFHREAALLASVDHPGLPRIHEVGEADGRPYLVMDLVEGRTLAEELRSRPRLPAERVVGIGLDLAGALGAVHRVGLVHRDVKPQNVMIVEDGSVRLIDFGLTARQGGQEPEAGGTLAYSAPEQSGMLSRPVDNRSDLYALGVVLFEALAGAPPFAADDVADLLRRHATAPAPDLTTLVPGVPRGLADAVALLLAKDPDDRYQNAAELAADLHRLAADPGAAVAGRSGWAAPLERPPHGRDAELATLRKRWSEARYGRGGAVLVIGAAGLGKVRLVAQLAAEAREAGAVVLHGRGSLDEGVPLAPLRSAVEAHLTEVDRLPAAERRRRRDAVRAAAIPGTEPLLARFTPGLAALFDVAVRPVGGDEEATDKEQYEAAVAALIAGLAAGERQPGLLFRLDDVQWLDPASVRLLRRLKGALDGVPLLLMGTASPEYATRVATGAALADTVVPLGPLDRAGVLAEIEALVPGLAADPDVARMLVARCGGNPLAVQEYLRAVVDAGLLRPHWGGWQLDEAGLAELDLPDDVLGLLRTRVRALGPQAREVLTTAAAVGPRFRAALVAAAHGAEPAEVLDVLAAATGHRLIDQRDGGEYGFLHHRVREALLGQLGEDELAALHGRIAEAMEQRPGTAGLAPEAFTYALARQRMAAPGVAPERALAACRAAAELALAAHAPGDAAVFLAHGSALGVPPDAGYLQLHGRALMHSGDLTTALELLTRALGTEPDPVHRAGIHTLLGDVHRSRWDAGPALDHVRQGLAELDALPRGRGIGSTLLLVLAALAVRLTGFGRDTLTGEPRRRCELMLDLLDVGGHAANLGGRPGTAIGYRLRSLYWAERLGHGRRYAYTLTQIGVLFAFLGLHGRARAAFDRAVADPSTRHPAVLAKIANTRGSVGYLTFRDDGQELARDLDGIGTWLDAASFADAGVMLVAEAVATGRTEEAERLLALVTRRLDEGTPALSSFAGPPLLRALQGRPADAAAALTEQALAHGDNPSPNLLMYRLLTSLTALDEQRDTGPEFESVVRAFTALRVPPRDLFRWYHTIPYLIARGRLEQARTGGDARRPWLLGAARTAVKEAGRYRRNDQQRARVLLLRADLAVLERLPRHALRFLDELPAVHPLDEPSLAFEATLVRARALAALGGVFEAERSAAHAVTIARQCGWPHRARAVIGEFGLRALDPSTPGTSLGVGDRGRDRLAALEQVSAAAARVLDPRELAGIALAETIRILAADRAFLFLVDEETGVLRPYLGRDAGGEELPELTAYSRSLVDRVRALEEPLVVTGTEHGAALGAESAVQHGLRSIMVAPLLLEGRLLGVVYLDSQVAKGIFTEADVGILTALTNHVATSLATARAAQLEVTVRAERRARDVADALRETLEDLTSTLDLPQLADRSLTGALRVADCDEAWLLRTSPDGTGRLLAEVGVADRDQGPRWEAVGVDLPLAHLFERREPWLGAPGEMPPPLAERLAGAVTWLVAPMGLGPDGRGGALVLVSRRPDSLLPGQVPVAATLITQLMAAYEKAMLFAQVQALAVTDELTGIDNRRRFLEVAGRDLASAQRHSREVTALMVDIDHFKRINDEHGHPTGDDVIREVARRLGEQIRRTDLVARWGGEEFALLLQDHVPAPDIPERLRAAVAGARVETRTGPLPVTVSIGIAWSDADDDLDTLFARADAALYEAKRAGRDRVTSVPAPG